MLCPNCGEILSNVGESQLLKRAILCDSPNHVVADLIVTYECDGARGCEGLWKWSRKTRRLTQISPPVVGAYAYPEERER